MRVLSVRFWALLSAVCFYQYYHSPLTACNFSLPSAPAFEGTLALNHLLTPTSKLFQGATLVGSLRPESFASDENGFYTGLGDGTLAHISFDNATSNPKLKYVLRTGTPDNSSLCGHPDYEYQCGRTLGMLVHPATKNLIACDSLGLLEINPKTKKVTTLVNEINGYQLKFCNDVELASDGKSVYFSESSRKYSRAQALTVVIDGCPDGAIYNYNFETKEITLITDNLSFPNGIIRLGNHLIVAETIMARLIKIPISGPQAGIATHFSTNLPGLPDNLQLINGELWVGLSNKRSAPFSITDFLANKGWLRKIIFGFVAPERIPIPGYGILITIDPTTGLITKSFHDPTGQISRISQVHQEGNYLYLGSWFHDFLGQLDIESLNQNKNL